MVKRPSTRTGRSVVKKPEPKRPTKTDKPAKSTKKSKDSDVPSLDNMGGEVLDSPLNEVIADNLRTYGEYVIEDRAIPSYQDGLKPSQRRSLWALYHALGNRPDKGYVKCARAEGATYQFHPHCLAGDTEIQLTDKSVHTIASLVGKTVHAYAYDLEAKMLVPATAYNIRKGKVTTTRYTVSIVNGGYIECTDNHPFLIIRGNVTMEWVEAKNLKRGDRIVGGYHNLYQGYLYVSAVSVEELAEPQTFYDFTVDGYENLAIMTKRNPSKAMNTEAREWVCAHNSGAYGTIVNMIEGTPTPLLTGYGNFGSFSKELTPPAAPRYSECKLSHFTMAMLFDKRYEKVYPRVPSYEGSSEEPVYLPAQLPLVLALGVSGIALGATTEIPAFTIHSLYHAVKLALKSENYKVPAKKLGSALQFASAYGGEVTSPLSDVIELVRTGQGQISWKCDYHIKDKQIHITGMPPGWSFDAKMRAIRQIPSVTEVSDLSSSNGINIRISFKRMGEEQLETEMDKVIKHLHTKNSHVVTITSRAHVPDELVSYAKSTFSKTSIVDLLAKWTKFRVMLEKKALKYEYNELSAYLDHQSLMFLATNSLDIIFAMLKKKGIDRVPALAKALKITEEQSSTIWAMQVRSLDRLSADQIKERIANAKKRQKEIKNLLAHPEDAVIKVLELNQKALTSPVAYET